MTEHEPVGAAERGVAERYAFTVGIIVAVATVIGALIMILPDTPFWPSGDEVQPSVPVPSPATPTGTLP